MLEIANLLGKSKSSAEVKELLDSIQENYRISRFNTSYYQCYEESGIEIQFTKDHYLQTIIFHNKGKDIAATYHLLIPSGINISDSRKVIETKLGAPERECEGSKHFNFWTGHPEFGFSITYDTFQNDDYEAQIKHICIYEPETETDRLQFLNKTDIYSFFRIYSNLYTPGILTELMGTDATRVANQDEPWLQEDENFNSSYFWEIYLSENEHLNFKSQLRKVLAFLNEKEGVLMKLKDECVFKLKFTINSLRTNSTQITLDQETLTYMNSLGISVNFEFNT